MTACGMQAMTEKRPASAADNVAFPDIAFQDVAFQATFFYAIDRILKLHQDLRRAF